MLYVLVYDSRLREWRSFTVPDGDNGFEPRCANMIHQFAPRALYCACTAVVRIGKEKP